jgi:hypothetical protein
MPKNVKGLSMVVMDHLKDKIQPRNPSYKYSIASCASILEINKYWKILIFQKFWAFSISMMSLVTWTSMMVG